MNRSSSIVLAFAVGSAPLPARADAPPSTANEWDEPATQDPQPASPPPTAAEPALDPAPRLESPPDHQAEGRGAKVVMHTGLGLLSGGVAALLFVALPARLLERRALERYESADSVYRQRAWLDRAYRRNLGMQISAGIGLGLITAGASLAIGGAIAHRSARRDLAARARRVVLLPSFEGFTLRF